MSVTFKVDNITMDSFHIAVETDGPIYLCDVSLDGGATWDHTLQEDFETAEGIIDGLASYTEYSVKVKIIWEAEYTPAEESETKTVTTKGERFSELDETKYYVGMDARGHKCKAQLTQFSDEEIEISCGYDEPTGVGVPIRVSADKKYVLEYSVSNSDACAFASFFDDEYNYLGTFNEGLNIKSGSQIVIPKTASWCVLILGGSVAGEGGGSTVTSQSFYNVMIREQPEPEEEDIEWMLETGTLGLDTPNQKFISRIQLRMDLKGTFKAEIAYDNGEYQTVLEKEHQQLHSTTIPIKVRRNDHFKIRLSGVGQIKLYSFGYETAEGSGRCLI